MAQLSRSQRMAQRAQRRKDGGLAFGSEGSQGADAMGVVDNAMNLFATGAPIIDSISTGKNERMSDKGALTHKVDTAGNIMSMGAAGAQAGMMFGPIGGAIGAGVGALAGGVMSILDSNNQPTFEDMVAKRESFNMGQMTRAIGGNDTFAVQAQAAEHGISDVEGTKQIEVEKDEIVLRKNGKAFKRVADFKGGKSHMEGGEDYTAQDGDIIFPGKMRNVVNAALRTRNWRRLESMRQQLPADTQAAQKQDGVKEIDPGKDGEKKGNITEFTKDSRKEWEKKYGSDTAYFMTYLDKTDIGSGKKLRDIVTEVAEKTGVDANFLLNTALSEGLEHYKFQEDYDKDYERYLKDDAYEKQGLSKEEYFKTYGHKSPVVSGVNNLGLDTIGTMKDTLVDRGYLDKEFFDKNMTPTEYTNEKGEAFMSGDFKDLTSGLTANAAFIKKTQDDMNAWTSEQGYDLTPKQRMFFDSVAYNAGEGNARKMIESYSKDGILENEDFLQKQPTESWSGPYKHASRRTGAMLGFHGENLLRSNYIKEKPAMEGIKPLKAVPMKTNNLIEKIALTPEEKPMYANGTRGIVTDPKPVEPESYLKRIKKFKIKGMEKGKRSKTDTIVIHRTAGGGKFNEKDTRLTKDNLGAQFWIEKDGTINQIGDIEQKMWHAGDFNDRSIGIEIVGKHLGKDSKDPSWEPLTPQQEAALKELTGFLVKKYDIPSENIVPHTSIANKTAGEGVMAAKIAQDYIASPEFKKEAVPEELDTGEPDLSDDPQLRARQEEMMAANEKKLGYTPYEQYALKEKDAGREPESESWYNQNIVEPAEEKKRGYWTIDSPTGRKNYESDDVVRTGINLDPKALSNDEKKRIIEQAKKDGFPVDGVIPAGTRLDTEIDDDNYVWRDIDKAIEKLPSRWWNSVENNLKDDYHGITDPKLKKEALAFENFLEGAEANGTLLGRKLTQAFNAVDQFIATGIAGVNWNDDAQVSTNIANLLRGESPETVETLINQAKEAGVLSDKGINYAWHVASDPEVFKTQEQEAVEDVNVALAVKDAPRALMRAGRGMKTLFKGVKNLPRYIKDGGLTPAGIRYLRNSDKFKMAAKAAKNAKDSEPAKELGKTLKEVYGSSYKFTGDESIEELAKLANSVDADIPQMGDFDWSGVKAFFNGAYNTIKKLPKSTNKMLYGKSYREVNAMEKELAMIAGTDVNSLRKMPADKLAKTIVDKRTQTFKSLEDAIKQKEDAWKSFRDAKERAKEAKQSLAEMRAEGRTGKDFDDAVRTLDDINAEVDGAKEQIKALQETTKTNWDQISKIEKWQDSEAVNTKWRQLVKGEEAVSRHLDNIDDLDTEMQMIKEEQKSWQALKGEAKGDVLDAIKERSLEDVVSEVDRARSQARSVTGQVTQFERMMKRAPQLAKEIQKHDDIVKEVNASGRFTAEMFNILRKRGANIDKDLEAQAEAEFSTEDIVDAGKTPPTEVREPVEASTAKELGTTDMIKTPEQELAEAEKSAIADIDPRFATEPTAAKKGSTFSKISGALDSLASYAPAIYNIARGLEEPDKVARRFVRPQTLKYTDLSDPQRQEVERMFTARQSNARNLSGGMMSNFRANVEQAWADKLAQKAKINAYEVGRSDQIAQANINIKNQAEQINQRTNQQADIMDLRSEAATNSFLAQGIQDVANIGQRNKLDASAKQNQSLMLNLINSGRPFTYDTETGKIITRETEENK